MVRSLFSYLPARFSYVPIFETTAKRRISFYRQDGCGLDYIPFRLCDHGRARTSSLGGDVPASIAGNGSTQHRLPK